MHLAIIIPVFNEEKMIGKVIKSLPRRLEGVRKISVIAVDDGSTDNSLKEIKKAGAKAIQLPVNLGYGGASSTGLKAATKIGADIAVTLDGDGQHNPADISKMIVPIMSGKADLVVGSRFKQSTTTPHIKRIGIRMMNVIIYLLSGQWCSDSQSGMKAFSQKALSEVHLGSGGMEFASEVILEAKRSELKITEVPILISYTEYSKNKGQSPLNGINILFKLIYKKLTS